MGICSQEFCPAACRAFFFVVLTGVADISLRPARNPLRELPIARPMHSPAETGQASAGAGQPAIPRARRGLFAKCLTPILKSFSCL
ncbi:hypothetical protein CBM2605_A60027 [Cupriavidus neocaledonicus]|uniref:Transposase n=1 Tax=Cupriavidus neocaledonicus TaxID=1040979 RepID=A0ABY1V3G2_9BURK|nr:hypothetical protein CBM2605_A60027 [Cupriavidus neocaledonicus]